MKCKIICHIEPDRSSWQYPASSPHSGNSITVAVCETHGWRFQGSGALTALSQCPIGQIEDATEEALGQIAQATKDIAP